MSAYERKRKLEALDASAIRRNSDGTVDLVPGGAGDGKSMTVGQAKALLHREGLSKKHKEKEKKHKKDKHLKRDKHVGKKKKKKKKRRRDRGDSSSDSSSDDSSDDSEDASDDKKKTRRWNTETNAAEKDEKPIEWGSPPVATDAIDLISEDDYYLKNKEFSVWLRHVHGKYFTDLLSKDARERFTDFVREWNARKLPNTFYREGGVNVTGRR
jgi:hypothetical protein